MIKIPASMIHRIFLSIIFLSCTLASFSQGPDSCLTSLFQQAKIAGLSVAVVKDNKIIYTHSYGLKNIENNTPLTDDCLFRIASISKSFTATALMQLVEQKKISLEDDVSDLAGFKIRNPNFPSRVITLRMILSHSSSINDSQGYFTLDVINPGKNPDHAKCYNDYEPGSKFEYCNLNYNMAGTILEKISGERFDQYVKHHILDPLGLYGGYCVDSLDSSRFATLYEFDTDSSKFIPSPNAYNPRRTEISNYVMGYTTPIFSPTGGMKISATDLAKYMLMHMNGGRFNGKRIISKKSSRRMQTPVIEEDGYGLAITTDNKLVKGEKMKGHTGSAYGLYSTMFFNPQKKFGIIAITNGYHSAVPGGMKAIVNCLYDRFIKKK